MERMYTALLNIPIVAIPVPNNPAFRPPPMPVLAPKWYAVKTAMATVTVGIIVAFIPTEMPMIMFVP